MKKLILILITGLSLTACMRGPSGDMGPAGSQGSVGDPGQPGSPGIPGAPAPTPAPVASDPVQDDINAILADENSYRLSLGQVVLSQGLSCTLYTTTGGDGIKNPADAGHTTLQGLSQVATFSYADVFNQADSPVSQTLNVLPVALRAIYLNMYMLRCQGQIVVRENGYYQFSLTSDDGSLLYVDGAKTIDNDNGHGAQTVLGMRYLRRGIHSFRLDYAQTGGGNQALILKANGQLIEGRFYAH